MPRFLVPAAFLLVLAAMIGLTRDQPGFTTVYVVRHAETEQTGDNPPLTETGRERARTLASILRSVELDAIYSTEFRRTFMTATPTVDSYEMPLGTYEPKETDELARSITDRFNGKTVLVVGHSNTVPMIIASLGAGEIENIAHDEHDNLYVVTITASGNAGLQRLRIP